MGDLIYKELIDAPRVNIENESTFEASRRNRELAAMWDNSKPLSLSSDQLARIMADNLDLTGRSVSKVEQIRLEADADIATPVKHLDISFIQPALRDSCKLVQVAEADADEFRYTEIGWRGTSSHKVEHKFQVPSKSRYVIAGFVTFVVACTVVVFVLILRTP